MPDVQALQRELEGELLDWESERVLNNLPASDDDLSVTGAFRLLGWCFSGLAVLTLIGIPTAPADGVWPYLLLTALCFAAIGLPCLIVARRRIARVGQLRQAHRGRLAQIQLRLANAKRAAGTP